jgi:Domain of unknown function (DUF4397)
MNWPAGVVRLARPLAILAFALGMLGYAVPAAVAAHGHGWLRLAHLSPNTPAVDVYLYAFGDGHAMVVLKHVSYGTVSPYQRVASGEYTVAMRTAGASSVAKPVLSTTVQVAPGHAYTVAGMGPLKGLRLQVMPDRLTAPPGKALVRVIQASMQQQRITVRAGAHLLASKLAFGTISHYKVVSPGTVTVRGTGETEHVGETVSLAADSIHTIVMLDDPGRLALTVLQDAAGSSRLPVQAPATGFGGTAPRPGPSPLPWLVPAAAGLALILIGGARLQRSRLHRSRLHRSRPHRSRRALIRVR